jgi:hypothetical protein
MDLSDILHATSVLPGKKKPRDFIIFNTYEIIRVIILKENR